MFALISSFSFQEMFVLLVIGLLLYGRNLPQAGRTIGRVAAQLRRGFHDFKDQMNRDADLSEMKNTLQSTKDEIRKVTVARRAVTNPAGALKDLTTEALSSPLPDDDAVADEGLQAPTGLGRPQKPQNGADL
ncbi:MAG: hypothetical protein NXI31_05610 [bacterium]|nr:hypothetical protein [bacterium]